MIGKRKKGRCVVFYIKEEDRIDCTDCRISWREGKESFFYWNMNKGVRLLHFI